MKQRSSDLAGWALTTAAAFGAIACLPLSASGRSAALLGAALSTAAGGLAALLVSRAARREGLGAAMLAIAVPFAVRAALVTAGLVALAASGEALPFVGAFFAVFFTQLLLETLLVLSRHSPRALSTPRS